MSLNKNIDLFKNTRLSRGIAQTETLRDFARVVARLIDFRNRFTATHSSGVAAVVLELAGLRGVSEGEGEMMEIAGFLHDLGKLAVPDNILSKNGELTNLESNIYKMHSFYTYVVLRRIRGLEHISTWAAHHHEKPGGNGYPFGVKGGEFTEMSRIMAAADIFTELTEDKPHRPGLHKRKVERMLKDMTVTGDIDEDIVELAHNHFSRINEIRKNAQQEARKEYDAFRESLSGELYEYKYPLVI